MTPMKKMVVIQIAGWSEVTLCGFLAPALKELDLNGAAKGGVAQVTLVTGRSLADWTVALPFDQVILIKDDWLTSKSWVLRKVEEFRLARLLKAQEFDLGLILKMTSALQKKMSRFGIKKVLSLQKNDENKNRLDSYVDLLHQLDFKPQKLNFKLRVRQHIHEDMMRRLAARELRSKKFIVVAPGGGENIQRTFHHKRWTHYAELIRLLCDRTPLPVVLLGGVTDLALSDHLTSVDPARVFSWIGKLSREESLAVVNEATAFVGNESGLSYIAGCAGIPAVVLYGPSSSAQRSPPGRGKTLTCIDGKVPCSPCATREGGFDWSCRDNACMKAISPEQVWSELHKLIKF